MGVAAANDPNISQWSVGMVIPWYPKLVEGQVALSMVLSAEVVLSWKKLENKWEKCVAILSFFLGESSATNGTLSKAMLGWQLNLLVLNQQAVLATAKKRGKSVWVSRGQPECMKIHSIFEGVWLPGWWILLPTSRQPWSRSNGYVSTKHWLYVACILVGKKIISNNRKVGSMDRYTMIVYTYWNQEEYNM